MKNLLITTIGKYNHFSAWIDGERDYDIAVVIYDDSVQPKVSDNTCLVVERFKTFKYEGIKRLFDLHPTLSDYDYFWMPDEDIWAKPEDINRIFTLTKERELWLSQPSILDTHDSFPSWKCFAHRPNVDLVHTNFIEVMCPCVSRKAMKKIYPLLNKSKSGWGLDLIWSWLGVDEKMGILNSVPVKHTRPVGGGTLYSELAAKGIYPSRERKKLMREFGIPSIDIKTWI